jgi:hypothetical protein
MARAGAVKRLLALFALAALAAGAWAQQPPAKKPVLAQKPVYDEYEPSQRQRLRRESCGRNEDVLGAWCVKKCERGYLAVSLTALPRRCRSERPLPPGSLYQGLRKQTGVQPVPPPRPAKPVPGDRASATGSPAS